jgi:hypothetical protein
MERPKNVPEELQHFLKNNCDEWFTNEQLAERLNQYNAPILLTL